MCNMTKKNPFCTILKVKNNNKELKNNSHNKHVENKCQKSCSHSDSRNKEDHYDSTTLQ